MQIYLMIKNIKTKEVEYRYWIIIKVLGAIMGLIAMILVIIYSFQNSNYVTTCKNAHSNNIYDLEELNT